MHEMKMIDTHHLVATIFNEDADDVPNFVLAETVAALLDFIDTDAVVGAVVVVVASVDLFVGIVTSPSSYFANVKIRNVEFSAATVLVVQFSISAQMTLLFTNDMDMMITLQLLFSSHFC